MRFLIEYKNILQMSQIGLTESVKGDARRFEIWLQGRSEVHTIQAPSLDIKLSWVQQIKGVLMSQLAELKGKQNSALGKVTQKQVWVFLEIWRAPYLYSNQSFSMLIMLHFCWNNHETFFLILLFI